MLVKTLPLMALAADIFGIPAKKPSTTPTKVEAMTTTHAHSEPSLFVSKSGLRSAYSFVTIMAGYPTYWHSSPVCIHDRVMESDHHPRPSFTPGPETPSPSPSYSYRLPNRLPARIFRYSSYG
ncbi:hypothetical protein GGS26DRAFT_593529 [Hypomontagnella submonticulosa]|nr:hypothetical protein GGS26DRAFT_593529 [Hypomontagnella submonticulosa]